MINSIFSLDFNLSAFFRFLLYLLSVFIWLAFCQTLLSRRVLQRGWSDI